MSNKFNEIDTELIKKEVKEELLKREIMIGLEEDEIDLFELFGVLKKHYKLVLIMPIVVAILVALYSLTLPNYYKSSATLYVQSKSGGLSSVLSSIPMAGMLGLGQNSDSGYLEAFLKSNTMSGIIIQKYGIATNTAIVGPNPKPASEVKYDELLKTVNKTVSISNDAKSGLITISAETMDAKLSADITNTYIEHLTRFASEPQRKKLHFLAEQLAQVNKDLNEAQEALKKFQDENKMFTLEDHAKSVVERMTKLQTEKFSTEVSMQTQDRLMQSFGSMPELVKLEALKVSEATRIKAINDEINVTQTAMENLPKLALEFARLRVGLSVKEKLFTMITEQHELAKIATADESSAFDIIDTPLVPELKSKPKRSIMVVLSGLLAGVIGVFSSFLIEFIQKRKQKEKQES
ncbi:MAG: Wzz/FepE/Etk N-terminal domain-containing protein [Candidatus Riflebacteria bacterium]|nr:Wzz/FepE/Etk N-terminal domain-containing protein [Candidatus Riflebacteria bacterium]